jgi:hypothetical protein
MPVPDAHSRRRYAPGGPYHSLTRLHKEFCRISKLVGKEDLVAGSRNNAGGLLSLVGPRGRSACFLI